MTKTMTREESINIDLKELFKDTSFEDYSYESIDTAEELTDQMQEEINNEEIIYYSNAMEYLSSNDNSLRESLEIAYEMGYELNNLSSEVLASILEQRNLREELSNLFDEIEKVYENHDV